MAKKSKKSIDEIIAERKATFERAKAALEDAQKRKKAEHDKLLLGIGKKIEVAVNDICERDVCAHDGDLLQDFLTNEYRKEIQLLLRTEPLPAVEEVRDDIAEIEQAAESAGNENEY